MFKYLNRGISTPIAITIIVILAVIFVSGVFAYQYYYVPKQETKNLVIETPIDETADWEVYRNEEYGFEMKYNADKYKVENNMYGWPDAIVLFSKFGSGQSYYLAIEVWDNESGFNVVRGYSVQPQPVFKKIGNQYISLWNVNKDPVVDQIISTFKFTK